METQTITITFCDKAENHVGMEQLGKLAENGFNINDLFIAKEWFEKKEAITELICLNYPIENIEIFPDDEAYILIIRDGINYILNENKSIDLFNELINLNWDSKALMYGRVVNKHARYNLCFANHNQEPDYANKKGRIISFNSVPLLNKIKNTFPKILGHNGKNLVAEGNYYYDINHCGIGYHGDSERKKVIGIRLGATIPLVYQWFHNGNSIGKKIKLSLNHGDIYFMSEKATGNDWKKKSIYTLRHAAGSTKYIH
jgi:alkylated DNA repair dioxygenase AlkB